MIATGDKTCRDAESAIAGATGDTPLSVLGLEKKKQFNVEFYGRLKSILKCCFTQQKKNLLLVKRLVILFVHFVVIDVHSKAGHQYHTAFLQS